MTGYMSTTHTAHKYQPKISLIYQNVMLSSPKHLARIVKQLI